MSNLLHEPKKPNAEDTSNEDDSIKLPRGPLFSGISTIHLVRAAMFGALLVGVILMRKPCSDSAAVFVDSFDPVPDAAPLNPLEGYELVPAEEALENWPDKDR